MTYLELLNAGKLLLFQTILLLSDLGFDVVLFFYFFILYIYLLLLFSFVTFVIPLCLCFIGGGKRMLTLM